MFPRTGHTECCVRIEYDLSPDKLMIWGDLMLQ